MVFRGTRHVPRWRAAPLRGETPQEDELKKLGTQTSVLVNLQRLDANRKLHPWHFVGNRIIHCLVCCMVMSLATAAQESHNFNHGSVSTKPTVLAVGNYVVYHRYGHLTHAPQAVRAVDVYGGILYGKVSLPCCFY